MDNNIINQLLKRYTFDIGYEKTLNQLLNLTVTKKNSLEERNYLIEQQHYLFETGLIIDKLHSKYNKIKIDRIGNFKAASREPEFLKIIEKPGNDGLCSYGRLNKGKDLDNVIYINSIRSWIDIKELKEKLNKSNSSNDMVYYYNGDKNLPAFLKELNGGVLQCVVCHEFAHGLIYYYNLDKNKELINLYSQKDKLTDLREYAQYSIQEFISVSFEYIFFEEKYIPKIANEVINIINSICC